MTRTRSAQILLTLLVVLWIVLVAGTEAGAATTASVALKMANLDGASTSPSSLAKYESALMKLQKNCSAPSVGAIGDDAVRARKSLGRGGVDQRVRLITIMQDVNRFIWENYTAHSKLACATVFNAYVALNT